VINVQHFSLTFLCWPWFVSHLAIVVQGGSTSAMQLQFQLTFTMWISRDYSFRCYVTESRGPWGTAFGDRRTAMQLQLDLLSHVHYIDREPPVLRCCSANRRASSQRSLRPDPTPQLPYRSDACKARAYSTFSSAACASARDLQSLGDNCKLTRHRQRSASALQGFGGAGLPNGDSSGFGGGNGNGKPLPTQGDMLVNPGESTIAVADRADESDALKSSDLDYLSVRSNHCCNRLVRLLSRQTVITNLRSRQYCYVINEPDRA
jgi:hypothetical protein